MAPSPRVGVRISIEMLTQIDGRIGADGKNQSEVVLVLIQKGLGIAASPDTKLLLKHLDELERRVR